MLLNCPLASTVNFPVDLGVPPTNSHPSYFAVEPRSFNPEMFSVSSPVVDEFDGLSFLLHPAIPIKTAIMIKRVYFIISPNFIYG